MRLHEDKYSFLALLSSIHNETGIEENAEADSVNTASYAMKRFQSEMESAATEAGINSEEDVMDLISQMRNEK